MSHPLWLFSKPPADHPPSVPYIRVDKALVSGLTTVVIAYVGVALAQWWSLPWSGQVPPGGIGTQLFEYPLLLLSYVVPHTHWLYDNPAYDARAVGALHLRLAPALVLALVAGVWRFRSGLYPIERTKHIAGPRLLESVEAEAALHAAAANELKGAPGFMTLAGVHLAKQRWTRGLLFYGSPGSGKTQAILPVVQQLIANNHRALVYDVKADFTAAFLGMNGTVGLFSPWDRRSLVWDIAGDCRSPSDAQVMATSLIPSDDGKNAFFINAARLLLEACLVSLQNEVPERWSWGELARRLSSDRAAWYERLEKHFPSALSLVSREGEQADNVLSSVSSYCKPIFDLAAAWPRRADEDGALLDSLSFRAWAEDGYTGPHRQVLLQAGPNAVMNATVYGTVLQLLLPRILSPALADNEMGRTLAFVLDELPSLGPVPFAELIERGRSKGVVFIGGCQSLDQIEEVWGTATKNSLGSMIGTHIVGRLQPSQSRDAIAELMGKQRVAITAVNAGGASDSTTVHEESRNAVQSYQLTELLGPREVPRSPRFPSGFYSRMLISGLGPNLCTVDFPGTVLKVRAAPHEPALWTTEPSSAGEHQPELLTHADVLNADATKATSGDVQEEVLPEAVSDPHAESRTAMRELVARLPQHLRPPKRLGTNTDGDSV